MNSNTIMILGDSTSMSVGFENKMYPFLLANANVWPADTSIINCSMPGFTSADASAFFFRHFSSVQKSLRAVIVYLGNCDAASSEVIKGKYKYWHQSKHFVREKLGKAPVKTRLKNRLLHFEWDNYYDPEIEKPENPQDFEYNIDRIIQTCRRYSIPVILVKPKANHYFPPGLGKGNFLFYRYLNMKEQIASRINIPDKRFKAALKFHESGNYKEAELVYKEILIKPGLPNMSQEYSLMVLNNFAISKAESGNKKEALFLLNLLIKERISRKEIFLYNIAQIHKNSGEHDKYATKLAESYESDASLYRIRSKYIDSIDRLAKRYPSVCMLIKGDLIPDSLYLDHCHPLPEGQVMLADLIKLYLSKAGILGKNSATHLNILYNPELSLGNTLKFHDYFKTYAQFSEQKISEATQLISKSFNQNEFYDSSSQLISSIPREIRSAVDYYFRHPCITSIQDIQRFPVRYPSDVGRFPEFFLIRHLIPFLKAHESHNKLAHRFDENLELLRSSEQLLSILPDKSVSLVDFVLPHNEPRYDKEYLLNLLSKVRSLLVKHLQDGEQIFVRIKSTIFWYVREALRFGAHSRVTMLYDRVLMEFLAEGLAVAGVLDSEMGGEKSSEIEELIHILQLTVQTHNEYCAHFSITNDTDNLCLDYNQKLSKILILLQAATTEK
jgi:tetratricopeptide (TPR) repeat protein